MTTTFEDHPDADVERAANVAPLPPLKHALVKVFQLEVEHELGAADRYHRRLRDGGAARPLHRKNVYDAILARPDEGLFEVRPHLPETLPQPDITCPQTHTTPGGRATNSAYHYRPERLRHLQERIKVLNTARSAATR